MERTSRFAGGTFTSPAIDPVHHILGKNSKVTTQENSCEKNDTVFTGHSLQILPSDRVLSHHKSLSAVPPSRVHE